MVLLNEAAEGKPQTAELAERLLLASSPVFRLSSVAPLNPPFKEDGRRKPEKHLSGPVSQLIFGLCQSSQDFQNISGDFMRFSTQFSPKIPDTYGMPKYTRKQ